MVFKSVDKAENRLKSDIIVVPFWQGKAAARQAASVRDLKSVIDVPISSKDYKGKEGQTLLIYLKGKKDKRLLLLGLGDEKTCTVERLRRSYAAFVKRCDQKKWKIANVLLPTCSQLSEEEVCYGVCEGISLTNYVYDQMKSDRDPSKYSLGKVYLVGIGKEGEKIGKRVDEIMSGVNLCRDLVNGNADDVIPETLAKTARELAAKYPSVKATIFDQKRIEKEKMGLILAVNQGSACEPRFIILEYLGNPKSKERTVVVGKGVTFDTGGLIIKPKGGMEDQRGDMSGGATAIGLIQAAAATGLKTNVTCVVPSVENAIGSRSMKPGDVFWSYAGKSVEMLNTDAEGRLILADAVAYAEKHLSPTRIIDLATLTGGVIVALGDERAGLFSDDDELAEKLKVAGDKTGELLWRMPIDPEYKDALRSEIADIKNIGNRSGQSSQAALFIKEFIKKTPWTHLDIAGTAYLEKPRRYHQSTATGFGVRLLVELLTQIDA